MKLSVRLKHDIAAVLTCLAAIGLCVGLAYGGQAFTRQVVSNELQMAFNVTESTPVNTGSPPASPEASQDITVNVDGGNAAGGTISTVSIKRTTLQNGTKRDDVVYTTNKARETVEQAVKSGTKTARFVIPDEKDEVSELNVTVPKDSLKTLSDGGLNLEIYTGNVRLILPTASLQGLGEDVYFRFVPIKGAAQRSEVEERARTEQTVQAAL